jgi:hypothetical protein
LFQRGELHADGLHRQAKPLGGPGDTPFFGHHPEKIQVSEVQSAGFHGFLSSVFKN